MDVFLTLFTSIAPLYAIIALGWIAGRFCGVDRQSVSTLAIYIVTPVISFYYVAGIEFQLKFAALPLVVFSIFSVMTAVFYKVGQWIYPDRRANLLAMCSAASNTGYLGLPIAILLMSDEWIGIYVFALVGGLLYEATVMYYIANRGNFSPKASLVRVLRFPVLYAIAMGLVVNFAGIGLPAQLEPYWGYFKGAYVVLGMMIIGLALSGVTRLVVAPRFLGVVFFAQFIVWPLIVFGLIALDKAVLHWYGEEIYTLLVIMAIVPPAANVVAFASQMNLMPEKAASTVLIGTLFALFYIPAVLILLGIN